MQKYHRFFVLLLLLPAFGLGCFRMGPRTMKGPMIPAQKQLAEVDKSAEDESLTYDDQFETVSSSKALAYLELNGGKAKLTRSGLGVEAMDGMEVESGDKIVAESGNVYLVYPESGKAQLEAGTELIFLADASNGLMMELKLTAGRVWTRFERLLGADEQYDVTANGVVATVRGTAFGVAVDADGVDIQVADHDVAILTDDGSDASARLEPVKLSAGEGLRVVTKGLLLKDIKLLRTAVRQLNVSERLGAGFKFGSLKIPLEKLARPKRVLRLKVPPSVPPDLQLLRQRMLLRATILKSSGTFVAPLRAPNESESAPLNSAPTINAPTTPLKSS